MNEEKVSAFAQMLLAGKLLGTFRACAVTIGYHNLSSTSSMSLLKPKSVLISIEELESMKEALIQAQIIEPLKTSGFRKQLDEPLVFRFPKEDCSKLASMTFVCANTGSKLGVLDKQATYYELLILAKGHHRELSKIAKRIPQTDNMTVKQFLRSYSPFSIQIFKEMAQYYMKKPEIKRFNQCIEELDSS